MSGAREEPRLCNHLGTTLRDRESAVRFRPEGMKRTESFNEWRYLILSIADTSVHTTGWGDRQDPSHETTF